MTTRDLDRYWANHFPNVEGWVFVELLDMLKIVARAQDEISAFGNVAEIGVYRGKLFIALAHMAREGERAVAIDIFDDQDKNIDRSSPDAPGPLFLSNYERFAPADTELTTIKTDSLAMTLPERMDIARTHGPFRLFSIDGGHTVAHAFNDLLFAQDTLAEGGVIILDDMYNKHWPGVTEAVSLFYSRNVPRVAPFLLGLNKLFLAGHAAHAHFLQHARERYLGTPHCKMVQMFGFDVMAVGP